ncbi:hypothetical protein [Vibrio porteresiae]|uniref:Uncharacterized protein n=1 Tax=Vibrio porteresiae DSM 19223 TaxID=1123496 RepID=A0ABZ0QJD8_9VIBR|nr:hypothetical protein [Vibrio porteresiae]WPC76619.1 hypothetical protein R8Z52_19005 [Vibrio porteresiae DSM 19223]
MSSLAESTLLYGVLSIYIELAVIGNDDYLSKCQFNGAYIKSTKTELNEVATRIRPRKALLSESLNFIALQSCRFINCHRHKGYIQWLNLNVITKISLFVTIVVGGISSQA